ncbi:uncharacterized protein C1orf21 homolog isoform X2 [Alosa pseudoharengus]|uniref:uncharacterized protein C1orf21 homolog isoform X2 n=1 Tax=Alosa sapidissima TaxID=34773 RepID=UPI001C08A670|nr:uncharacterized protein C1orf21 homolog isoform X2 [Alosa sapidissima]
MGCTSAKQLSAVPNEDEGQGKAYSNGDAFSEYRAKGVDKVKHAHGEEDQVNACNQENLEKSTLLQKGKLKDSQGVNGNKISIHSSESQQEFFRMLDEKIERGRDYCSEEEDVT